jgi:hypothetical protein
MDPSTNWSRKKQFGSLTEGIDGTAGTVSKNWGRAGGDLNKMAGIYAPQGAGNDPRGLNKNWEVGVQNYMGKLGMGGSGGVIGNVGSGGGAAALDVAKQFSGMNEYRNVGALSQFMGGRDPRGAANAWCAAFVNSSLKAVGGKGTGSAVANSFQKWGSAVNDHAAVAAGDVLLETAGKKLNQPGGHVGFATGKTRQGKHGLELEMFGGNQGDAAGYKWTKSNSNLMVRRGTTDNVPPNVTSNVPTPAQQSGGVGLNSGSGGGSATININGSTHDPEALANNVQKRIDESLNWRTHDVDNFMI